MSRHGGWNHKAWILREHSLLRLDQLQIVALCGLLIFEELTVQIGSLNLKLLKPPQILLRRAHRLGECRFGHRNGWGFLRFVDGAAAGAVGAVVGRGG